MFLIFCLAGQSEPGCSMLPCKSKWKHLLVSTLPGLEGEVQHFMKDIMIGRIMRMNASGAQVVLQWKDINQQVPFILSERLIEIADESQELHYHAQSHLYSIARRINSQKSLCPRSQDHLKQPGKGEKNSL